MNSVHSSSSLPWRLAVAAFALDLVISVAGTGYDLLASEHAQLLRTHYGNGGVVVTMAAFSLASALLPALASWCWAHGWLRRRGADAVEQPGRVLSSFVAALLVFYVIVYAGMGPLQAGMERLFADWWAPWTTDALGLYQSHIQRGLFVLVRVPPVVLVQLAGVWLCLRLALSSSRPGGAPRAALAAGQAASIAALALILWQTLIGGHMANAVSPLMGEQNWLPTLVGYVLMPLLLYGVGGWAALRGMRPAAPNVGGCGRAVLLGSLAYWLTQLLGVGLMFLLVLYGGPMLGLGLFAMMVLGLLVYCALAAFSMWILARLLYRRGAGAGDAEATVSDPQSRVAPSEAV